MHLEWSIPPGKCFLGKCFYLRRSECVLGYSSEWKMLPADSETTSFRVLECFQITQLLWALLVKFHSGLFSNKCPHKILPVHWACSPGCQSISWFLFLPSFLLLILINPILYDRDVIENLCLFFCKPHYSHFRYIFLGEEILYYDNKRGRQDSSHDSFKTGGWPALSSSHWMGTAVNGGHSCERWAQLGLRNTEACATGRTGRQRMTTWYGSCLGVTVVSQCDDPRPAASGSTWSLLEMLVPGSLYRPTKAES